MNSDAIVKVRFKTTSEDGRERRIEPHDVDYYACSMVVDGQAFDCRLVLNNRSLELGETYEIPVKFLNWNLVAPVLRAGEPFVLREGRDVAEGHVVLVFPHQVSDSERV